MKKFTKIIILTLALVVFFQCGNTRKNTSKNSVLLALILANPSGSSDKSLFNIYKDPKDLTSFTGSCFDSFTLVGVPGNAQDFYNATGGATTHVNSGVSKWALSTKSCSDLGFSGGVEIYSSKRDAYNYKEYHCSPDAGGGASGECQLGTITAAGF